MGVKFFYDESVRKIEEQTGHSIEDFMDDDYFIGRGLAEKEYEPEENEEEE